jgi:hypothetical protein
LDLNNTANDNNKPVNLSIQNLENTTTKSIIPPNIMNTQSTGAEVSIVKSKSTQHETNNTYSDIDSELSNSDCDSVPSDIEMDSNTLTKFKQRLYKWKQSNPHISYENFPKKLVIDNFKKIQKGR